jgi:hypothetical protein
VIFVVACTGPSMSPSLIEQVRGYNVLAVNIVYQLAPWAYGLVANDRSWWTVHADAKNFAGRKFSANVIAGVERVSGHGILSSTCSGVVGLQVAKQEGATKVILVAADFHGTHYFGKYKGLLNNTSEARRKEHGRQFARWGAANKNIEVLNATPGSHLKAFPIVSLREALG